MIPTYNDGILKDYGTFVVSTPHNLSALDTTPLGLPLRWHIDPLRRSSSTFLDLLQTLDGLTFGPEGMPMDKWVFYDCAELPGFIYGFAAPASELRSDERGTFGVPEGYDGPVPFSMYIAIPMHEEGAWFGHNLASLNRVFPDRGLHHLGTMTKAIALKVCQAEQFVGATQWKSKALFIHAKFGPLKLHTGYTPAHSLPETLTYGFDVNDDVIRAAAGDPAVSLERPETTFTLNAEDVEGMIRLQADIEAGEQFVLVGAPRLEDGELLHDIHRV